MGSRVYRKMSVRRWLTTLVLAGASLGACAEGPVEVDNGHNRYSHPSFLGAPSTTDLARLATTEDCKTCHADVASQWAHSVHARSSFDNPWYRASVDAFREARGPEASRFCAGCHDPLLLVAGDIDVEVDPGNALAYAGVTCTVCHSVQSSTPDGNGSLSLSDQAILIPDPAVPEEIEAHRRRLTLAPLRTEALCGSCHRSFSGRAIGNEHHLAGIEDLGDWLDSAFGGGAPDHVFDVETARCQDCHMPEVPSVLGDLAGIDGSVREHRWASSHTAMASQLDPESLAGAIETLRAAAVVDVGAVRVGDERYVLPEEAVVTGGHPLVLDILLENRGAGHRFPGGTRDMHDVWVEVEIVDASGRVLGVSQPDGNQDGVFILRSTLLDDRGDPETLHQVHRFSTAAFDRTIPAHGTQVVRYEMQLPARPRLPLQVNARLMHRKHSLAFQRLACLDSQSERGRAFAEGAVALGKVPLDPCLPQPVTTIADATVWLGRNDARLDTTPRGGAARATQERLLSQARGLLGETQERTELARPSLNRVIASARKHGSTEALGRGELLLARLHAQQGRPEQAVEATRRAETALGKSATLDRVVGDAYAQVWRWREAVVAYEKVVRQAPRSPAAWRSLAHAYGSLADDSEALRAANEGLRWAPRDEGLLRTRALALRGLGDPEADAAEERWLRHRVPDSTPGQLARCEQKHVRCQTDRQPIPRYRLVEPPTKAIPGRPISR
ncbi:MAG: multiheme c-type cytochrome [Myxococcota bacterium]